jgi:hypothetical protein
MHRTPHWRQPGCCPSCLQSCNTLKPFCQHLESHLEAASPCRHFDTLASDLLGSQQGPGLGLEQEMPANHKRVLAKLDQCFLAKLDWEMSANHKRVLAKLDQCFLARLDWVGCRMMWFQGHQPTLQDVLAKTSCFLPTIS